MRRVLPPKSLRAVVAAAGIADAPYTVIPRCREWVIRKPDPEPSL